MSAGLSSRSAPAPIVIDVEPEVDNRVLIPTNGEQPSQPPSDRIDTFGGDTMGTTWAVRAVLAPGLEARTVRLAVHQTLADIIAVFSHWEPMSELSRFNTAPAGRHKMSEPFWAAFGPALALSRSTDGAVDPALGALVDLWGFGPSGASRGQPKATEIAAALAVSGWHRLCPDDTDRTLIQPGGLRLDLSGIAKGHAVDRVSETLSQLGVAHHLVEIGGELRGRGIRPDGQPWWTEIERPYGLTGPRTLVALHDLSIATSGDAERYRLIDNVSYSHTLDGRFGRPIDNGMVSVTVLADTALRADALATALTVMGSREAAVFADRHGIAALMVWRTADGLCEILTKAATSMLGEDA